MGARLSACIVYSPSPVESAAFYERAFGMARRFASGDGSYAEVGGETPIGFAAEALVEKGVGAFTKNRRASAPAGVELCIAFDDVDGAYARAIEAGAVRVAEPTDKPWGQRVAYVRDVDGVLVELCTPWSPPPS